MWIIYFLCIVAFQIILLFLINTQFINLESQYDYQMAVYIQVQYIFKPMEKITILSTSNFQDSRFEHQTQQNYFCRFQEKNEEMRKILEFNLQFVKKMKENAWADNQEIARLHLKINTLKQHSQSSQNSSNNKSIQILEAMDRYDYEMRIKKLNEKLNEKEDQIGKIQQDYQLEIKDLKSKVQQKQNHIAVLKEKLSTIQYQRQIESFYYQNEQMSKLDISRIGRNNFQSSQHEIEGQAHYEQFCQGKSNRSNIFQNTLSIEQQVQKFEFQWGDSYDQSKLNVQKLRVERKQDIFQKNSPNSNKPSACIFSDRYFPKTGKHKVIFRIISNEGPFHITVGIMTSKHKDTQFEGRLDEIILYNTHHSTNGLLVLEDKEIKKWPNNSLGTKPGGCIEMIVDFDNSMIVFTRMPFKEKELKQQITKAYIPETFKDKDVCVWARLTNKGDKLGIVK